MARRVPLVLRHPDVVLQLVVEGRARALLDLRVEDAVDAAVVALLAVEVAVDRFRKQGVDDVIFLLARDQDVDVELGPKARGALDELERRHLRLGFAAGLQGGRRALRGGGPAAWRDRADGLSLPRQLRERQRAAGARGPHRRAHPARRSAACGRYGVGYFSVLMTCARRLL